MALRRGMERRSMSAPSHIWRAILEAGLRQLDPDALDAVPEVIDQPLLFDPDNPGDDRELARSRETGTGS